MVNEEEGGGISGLSSILGSFGFGGGVGGKYNLERILELSLSQNIIQQAIFKKVEIEGKKYVPELIGNEHRYLARIAATSRGQLLQISEDGKYEVIRP